MTTELTYEALTHRIEELEQQVATLETRLLHHQTVNEQVAAKMQPRTEAMAHIGSWHWNIATDEVTWSEELFRLFGRDPALGAPPYAEHSALYSPEDMENLGQLVRKAVQHGKPYDLELKIHCPDGTFRHCKAQGFPERGPSGQVENLYGFMQDISHTHHIQMELQQSEIQFRTLFENAADAVYLLKPDGFFIDANAAAQQQTGYSREELLNISVAHLDPRAVEENDRQHVWDHLKAGQTVTLQTRHLRKDGSSFPAEINISVMELNHNRIIIGFVRDVTEKNRVIKNLKLSEERLSLAFQGANDGLWDWDLETNETFFSPRWKSMLGYEDHEIENRLEEWERLVAPEDSKRSWQALKAYLNGEQPSFDIEFRMKHKKGHWVDILSRAFAIRTEENQKPIRLVGTHVDITERNEMQRRLEQSQRLESIGNLAGGIAHDFNNLLHPIMGFSELLLLDLTPGTREYKNTQEILSASKRGRDLIESILAFGRQSEGKKKPIQLQNLLEEIIKMARATIPSNIEILHQWDVKCGVIEAHVTQIHQVVMNLVTNAYHAIGPNEGRMTIELEELNLLLPEAQSMHIPAGRYARLRVTDTGCGIEPEHQGKIFEPYFTTKEQGKGTGIGLSTVYGIVHDHGGEIKVESKPGNGSTFDVYLPIMTRINPTEETNAPGPVVGGKERILLVDDDDLISSLEKSLLQRIGYQVTAMVDSRETLALFASDISAFDLIITDMTMPGMTGDQLAGKIHALRPELPIIACTGYSDRLDKDNAKAIGIRGVLYKPVSREDLAGKVRQVLDEAGKSSGHAQY